MFNPRPEISRAALGPDAQCVVLDNVLSRPDSLLELAVQHADAFAPASGNAFPGLELPLPPSAIEHFVELFARHARQIIGARRVLSAAGRLSMVTLPPASLSPIQRVCHRDRLAVDADQCAGAAVLYLFSDAMLGGTSFYRARHDTQRTDALMRHWSTLDGEEFSRETGWPSAYMTTSNEHFERIAIVEPRWNRLVFYDGSVFHSSHIEHPERLSSRPAQGRLTLNLFFVCRRSAR